MDEAAMIIDSSISALEVWMKVKINSSNEYRNSQLQSQFLVSKLRVVRWPLLCTLIGWSGSERQDHAVGSSRAPMEDPEDPVELVSSE